MNKGCCCAATAVVIGLALFVAGIIFIPVSNNIIHKEVEKEVTLNSSETYKNWIKNPVPIYFQIWVWNLTNPEEVQAGKSKPSIAQKGPYTYSEHRQKVDITFHDNDTVTYRELRYFAFERDLSVEDENDTFTTVNIPMMTVANIVSKEFSFIQEMAEALLEWAHEDLFITLSVKDIIWGYKEPLISKFVDLAHKFGYNISLNENFGLFVGTNGSDDGWYNIYTGNRDSSRFGMIDNWNYMKLLNYWTTKTCNMVNGTDGTIYPPFVKRSNTLYLFSSDLCRSIYLSYTKDEKLRGIPVYRFNAPKEVFYDAKKNPANEGFCVPTDKECLPSGLLNVESCRDGAPVVFSQPHFLDADESVIHAVDGVHPDHAEHSTVIDLEPYTGAALNAAKKLQVNIQLKKIDHITATEKLVKVVLPIIWLNESAIVTKSLADEFKSKLQTPMMIIHIVIYVAIGVGALLVIVTVLVLVVKKFLNKQPKELQNLPADETTNLLN